MGLYRFDKRYVDGLECKEYDGLESYYISKPKHIFRMIEKNLDNLGNQDLGEFIRAEMARSPLEYNNEWSTFLLESEVKKMQRHFL